jgi:PPK2 family polyphosphate:nucleotide phosphotransferase
MLHEQWRIKPGSKVKLSEFDPGSSAGFDGTREEAAAALLELNQRLDELQYRLYAEDRRAVLIVLQGLDGSGKDGTLRDVFEGVSPAGVRAVSFKVPSAEEMHHDYLWRIHKSAPAHGEIGVFNRSHYESVLVERVRELVPEKVWRKRFDQINAFEEVLSESGTTVLKFFLHISKDEQAARLRRRLDDPKRNWKFNPQDLEERKRWDRYHEAYEDTLERCSRDSAPWYVVPGDRKWYRNLVVASAIVATMDGMNITYPRATFDAEHAVLPQ